MSDECGGLTWALGGWEGSHLPPPSSRRAVCRVRAQGSLEAGRRSWLLTVVPPSPWGMCFQALEWTPETPDSTEPYIFCFCPEHTYLWKGNLSFGHSKSDNGN